MTRPNDIPEDVWKAAIQCGEYVLRNLPSDYGDLTPEIVGIARAILVERARCAKVADDHAQALRGNFDRSCAIAVEGVASAIRSGA